jgi:hypothetical protein
MQDQDLIEIMPAATEAFLRHAPGKSDALIQRWFGQRLNFGHV